jgi:seryl-tRNA synthetase
MFDIKWIRDNPEAFDAGLKRRGISPGGEIKFSADLIALDEQRRKIVTRLQEAQARRNAASKEIGKAKAAKDEAKASALMTEVSALKDELDNGAEWQKGADKAIADALSGIPNIPLDEVPLGKSEHDNKEVRRVGTPPKLSGINKPKEHFEIGEALGLMDFETAAKLSGSRFVVLKGQLAKLERALAQFMLDLHTAPEKGGLGGYTEIVPPYLVRSDAMFGTAQLPKFEEDQFGVMNRVAGADAAALIRDILDRAEADGGALFDHDGLSEHGEALRNDMLRKLVAYWLIPTAEAPPARTRAA